MNLFFHLGKMTKTSPAVKAMVVRRKVIHICEARFNPSSQDSNQISFIGLESSQDYYKRLNAVLGVCGKGHLGASLS